jgi:hypothetical protein
MKKRIRIPKVTTLFIVLTVLISTTNCSSDDTHLKKSIATCEANLDLKSEMRKVWEEHSYWTRNVILCITDDLPGKESAIKRLLQNQVDIGDMIKPYYGKKNGEKLTELLITHIKTGEDVFYAMKSYGEDKLKEANKQWYTNGDEISEFLNGLNPNWKLSAMKMMMSDHLKLTAIMVEYRLAENYEKDVEAYDNARAELLEMADMFSDVLVNEFIQGVDIKVKND